MGRVLLGGSRAFGEAKNGSDADFYVISPPLLHWLHRSLAGRARLLKTEYPMLNVMFIPWSVFRSGRLYVWGRDWRGKAYQSGLDRRSVFRNSLKLGHLALLTGDSAKAAKCAATARAMLKDAPDMSEPVFSSAFFKMNSVSGSAERRDVKAIGQELAKFRAEGKGFLGFSFANWLAYNLHFIPRLDFRFLFLNPDPWVIKRLERGEKMDRYVFPIAVI